MKAIKVLKQALPVLDKILFNFFNLVGVKERFSIRYYSKDAGEYNLFWGAIVIRKGEQYHLELSCTSAAFKVLEKTLKKNNFNYKNLA